ncbi:MAG: hypothetical protein AAF288_00750 [Planctomycetota bacterium]
MTASAGPDRRLPKTADSASRLIVFSDDWGRHPSSCQHLVRELMRQRPGLDVLWVNSIGMRRPNLSRSDLRRALGRIFASRRKPTSRDAAGPLGASDPAALRIVSPWMYPGFRSAWQRRFNARRMIRAVCRGLASSKTQGEPVSTTLLTTLPITADLIDPLRDAGEIDRVVYYAVDDFSVWPGVDGGAMDAMERAQAGRVDAVVCAGEVLRDRVRSMLPCTDGRRDAVKQLSHGVDLELWGTDCETEAPNAEATAPRSALRSAALFWGLIDERMDLGWLRSLATEPPGVSIDLVGPVQAGFDRPDVSGVTLCGPASYIDLPKRAQRADVLVMPYVDAPVTRAMAPLKLLEYLAAGWPGGFKPVVVRDLPATRPWADCCDVVSTQAEFVRVCRERVETGCPPDQAEARQRRLPAESWSEKARELGRLLFPEPPSGRDR